MGASASVSNIPLRPEFDLDTVQDIVGDDEWKDVYGQQFHSVAGETGVVSYENFVSLYQRNLLQQTSPLGLLQMLRKKFTKVLSGEGSEEAMAAVKIEQQRRRKEALDVNWECPVCSVSDQQGEQCSICTAENPKLAEIAAQEAALEAEPPVTERDVLTVDILLEKVKALEESVTNMATFLQSISQQPVVDGGAQAYTGPDAMSLKLQFLQSHQGSVETKTRQQAALKKDIHRYDQTIAELSDPTNVVVVARTPTAKLFLERKVARVQEQRKAAVAAIELLSSETDKAEDRYRTAMKDTREDILPPLLDGIQVNTYMRVHS